MALWRHTQTLMGVLGLEGREGDRQWGSAYSRKDPLFQRHLEFSMAGWSARQQFQ